MKKHKPFEFFRNFRLTPVMVFLYLIALPAFVFAQGDGPRFYWKGLAGMNAMPVIGSSLSGNANPMDPAHVVEPGSDFLGTMAMPGYARVFSLFHRSAMASLIVPMGRISSHATLNGFSNTQTAMGFGDPMLQLGVNLVGPKAMKGIPDMLRYKPGFSLDLIGSLAVPIGRYDNKSPVNIGQHRWYGRIGLPVVWQLGPWVPGRRTTLELLPAVWFFSDNNDYVGQKLETKPLFQVEGHLTRDFMERFWGSLDAIWYTGAESAVDTLDIPKLNNFGVGGTLGYQINDNLQLTVAYTASVNDSEPEDLKMDAFRVTLIYGWHKLIEGMHRIKGNE
jgi:hypothetical protein